MYNMILLIYTVFPAPSLGDTQSQQSISIDRMKLGVENRAVITATQQAEARESQLQGLPRTQNRFKFSLGNLVNSFLKVKVKGGLGLEPSSRIHACFIQCIGFNP